LRINIKARTERKTSRLSAINAPVRAGAGRLFAPGAAADEPVVVIVSVAEAVVAVELRVILDGETLQVVSAGMLHCGTKLKVPLKPYIEVNVSVVLAEPPGLLMVTAAGFAEIEKVGVGVTASAVDPVEPA
jgi:hypothetical protein